MKEQLDNLYSEVSDVFIMICGLDSNLENISESIKHIKLSKFWLTNIMIKIDKDFKYDYSFENKHEDKLLTFLLIIKEKMDKVITDSNEIKSEMDSMSISDYFRNYWDNIMNAYYFIDAQILILSKIKCSNETEVTV
jgi:hypothetical protein